MASAVGTMRINSGLGVPILIVLLLIMVILPLPPFLLDLLFTFNIALSLIVLLTSVYSKRPLDFAVFPSILLIATLLRLALNIASTRVILLNGHLGTDAAGKVVESFGSVVIGSNYAVGLVVFAILVIINFVVVTKGAGRVSEVSARFTLDALPGKQMAIDADLNAGLISQEDAKLRRAEVRNEADFYGSMDGSSKFVRGDAIAGLLVLFINIVGGLIIGMVQHNLDFNTAMENYTLLTIGDGLVAQVPSLLLSTAAAIIVTRISSEHDMGQKVSEQIFENPRALFITAGIIGALGLIPGMPHLAFILLAGAMGGGAQFLKNRKEADAIQVKEAEDLKIQQQAETVVPNVIKKDLDWDEVVNVDAIGLEVGYRLIPLVDKEQGGKLMERIKGIRRKLSMELGFLIPPVHIRDNLELPPSVYRISLLGVTAAEGEVHVDKLMAINSGKVYGDLEGVKGRDPAFGLDTVWIAASQKDYAQSLGYTVVDPSTVVATHINQIMKQNAADLFGHEEAQQLFDKLKQVSPKLVEELNSGNLPLSLAVKVMQNLLREQIPVSDIKTIAETLAENIVKSRDSDTLTTAVRVALNRLIVQNINGLNPELSVTTLAPDLEQLLLNAIQVGGPEGAAIEPGLVDRLQRSMVEMAQRNEVMGLPSVLLVSPMLRNLLAKIARYSGAGVNVLSYQEIPDNKQIKVVGTIGR